MSKKIVLITVFIVSLMLIGLMMLVADARIEVLDGFTTMEQKFQEANESVEATVDSLQKKLETSEETIPEIVMQFNAKATDLLEHIQMLKQELIPNSLENYNYEDPEIAKNNAIFFVGNDQYSENGKQFFAKIEAYENAVAVIHLEFPKTNTQAFKLRQDIRENTDWLNYNFKGFPVIASYVKLVAMENDIQSKKEIIFSAVLSN